MIFLHGWVGVPFSNHRRHYPWICRKPIPGFDLPICYRVNHPHRLLREVYLKFSTTAYSTSLGFSIILLLQLHLHLSLLYPTTQGWKPCAVTTLGRGGSDLTASTIGKALGLRQIQVWKDVDGVLTCDLSIHSRAEPVPYLQVVNANVSLKRLEELLLAEERVLLPNPPLQPGAPAISIKDGFFSWDPKAEKPTLSNVSLDIQVGSLVAVVGSTGEGKTSLVSRGL